MPPTFQKERHSLPLCPVPLKGVRGIVLVCPQEIWSKILTNLDINQMIREKAASLSKEIQGSDPLNRDGAKKRKRKLALRRGLALP